MRSKLIQAEKLMTDQLLKSSEFSHLQIKMTNELARIGRLLANLEKLEPAFRNGAMRVNGEEIRRVGQYSSQISVNVTEVAGMAQQLSRKATKKKNKFHYIAEITTITAFAIFSLFVLIAIGTFGTGLLQRLQLLQKGAGRLAERDFQFRFSTEEHDEIADLSRAFDSMAEALELAYKELQVTNSSLQHEVEERLSAEKQVRTLNSGLEEKVRLRTDELEQALRTAQMAENSLKKAMTELQQSNQDLEQFAYVASHDLQEPLRMVSSFTQLLQKRYQGKLDQDADEFIQFAVDGAIRMQQLINDLLSYSRVATRGKPPEPVDLNITLGTVRANLHASIAESAALVTNDPLPTVIADPLQMAQLLQNLIANAVKFRGDAPPRVHLSAQETDKEWIVSVRDNGIGIDPEFFQRIFVVFQRLHSGVKYPGSGIGLAICKKIVERHAGSIRIESTLGEGANFIFTIPKQER